MKRIDHPTAEADKFGAGKPGFSEGDPEAAVPATVVTGAWLDDVQEELARAVEVFEPLDPGDPGQLASWLAKLTTPQPFTIVVPLRACPLRGVLINNYVDSGWVALADRDYLAGCNGGVITLDLVPYMPKNGTLSKVTIVYTAPNRTGTNRPSAQLFSQRREVVFPDNGLGPHLTRTFPIGSPTWIEVGGEQEIELAATLGVGSALSLRLKASQPSNPSGDTLHAVWLEGTTTVI